MVAPLFVTDDMVRDFKAIDFDNTSINCQIGAGRQYDQDQ